MDEIDPAKKQYIIFAAIISILLSGVINFWFIEILEGSPLYGVPVNLEDVSDVVGFVGRIINSVMMGLFLTPLIYWGINWLQNRGGGGYY